ncbi:hypothetical protein BDA96_08G010500 [Sorghum bicolor]|uniref:F-box domain-containing protein n=1 Tax=Sorghum bicolor TaxID=4558 RepID=A0A921QCG4_SORBI|nr:hypothetical protein BDA96_08G010500 [Sorghum bicolor]
MERQPGRRRRRAQTTHGLVASQDNKKGSPCQQDAGSQGVEIQIPSLPEDIWCYIHSLMPMRSAARAACVSRAFLRSWRCHPNLTFSARTLRSNKKEYKYDDIARDFCSKIDQILKRHSGIGVKKLNIQMCKGYNGYLDSWLQVAVKSGIEELSLDMPTIAKYSFPCSLLSNGSGDSIRYLHFTGCSFRPTTELGCLRSLTKLHLYHVGFTGDDLGCLLSNSFALEVLGIRYCDGIGCLKVPCTLQRLRYLEVLGCCNLGMIESKAPNIFSFDYEGKRIQLSLGETLQMKELRLSFNGAVSEYEMKHVSIFSDLSDLRKIQGQQHHKMKTVKILGFTSAKSLIELTCHIVESMASLECLTLETYQSSSKCFEPADRSNECSPLPIHVLKGAQRGLLAIRTYIEPKAPAMVELHVVETCRRCH